jgi:hypothetical protein
MVEEVEITISKSVIDYLDNLIRVLYKEAYFGFIDSAEQYVANLYVV